MKVLKNELVEYVKEFNRKKRKHLCAFRENAAQPRVNHDLLRSRGRRANASLGSE